jgi:hypothetical protein
MKMPITLNKTWLSNAPYMPVYKHVNDRARMQIWSYRRVNCTIKMHGGKKEDEERLPWLNS